MREQLVLLPEYLTAHLQLTLLALLLSTVVSLPLGVAIARFRWLESPTLALVGIIQTVPGLALLAVMVPLLAAMNLPSIGFLPAIVGLTLYGLFPILRNTVTGIRSVDAALKEAARGVGMTSMQQLWRVEIPLALPMIVAGLRTATVWLVGITTLSTPIGATSLGNYIFSGLQTRNYSSVLIGCVAAGGLALLLDGMIRLLEIGISARRRGQVLTSLAIMTSLCIYVGITLIAPVTNSRTRPLVIGSKTFTEQYVLSSILAQWIEKETSRPTTLMQSLGSSVAFDALTTGEIDLYVDYSGTLWVNEMHRDTGPSTRREILNALRQFLGDEHNISMPAALGFENAYALAVRGNDATRLTLRQISDLRASAATLVLGGDYEFFVRPEWTAIQDAYGLEFKHLRTMDSTLMYQAIIQENVDVISAFSSDGRVAAYDLTLLEDDLNVIPPYDAIVLASPRVTQEYPDVIQAVARLNGSINADRMRTMNLAVDEMGEHPSLVAERFVRALR